MARKRDRRTAGDSSGHLTSRSVEFIAHKDPSVSIIRQHQSKHRHCVIFFIFFVASTAISVFIYRINYASRLQYTLTDIQQRGLVKPDVNYQEILAEHEKVLENASLRHYTFPVLAYVTPWNSKGYDHAKKFNSKFTYLSPVWYDLKSQGRSLILEGRHNADIGWMYELKMKGGAKLTPRVVLEAFPKELLWKRKLMNKAIDLILAECREMKYDGIVLESWSRWAAYGILVDPIARNLALQFIKQLGQTLHSESSLHLELIYVISPPNSESLGGFDFGAEDLQILSDAVDGFSLMTYDFSSPNTPGPNAPLPWVQSSLGFLLGSTRGENKNLARKIFLGINFYGNDFVLTEEGGWRAIIGREYVSILEKHKPLVQWEKSIGEHLVFYYDSERIKHAVFYPTLLSISMRLEEAHAWGAGISIWEIGQGLDYFFDLL